MNTFIKAFFFSPLVVSCAGCVSEPSEAKDQRKVQEQQEVYQIAQPIPHLPWSLERDIVIQLYEARNKTVSTYTVWRGETSIIEGHCPSIGYPIPYDTSLTNPLQISWVRPFRGAVSDGVIEQPEPNGVFASKNSTATWVRCVVNDRMVPVYVESKVTAYPFPVEVKGNTVSFRTGVEPSVVLQEKAGK